MGLIKLPILNKKRTLHIFNQRLEDLESWLKTKGQPSYKAKQILHWIHHEGVIEPCLMTNLSKKIRQLLEEAFDWQLLNFSKPHISSDGCVKWLLVLPDGNQVETVFIPEKGRATLCVSSQAGCALACKFCSTGAQGFSGNLTMGEIIGQVWMARHLLAQIYPEDTPAVTNVVMMGMGEPLLNAQEVTPAVNLMMCDQAYGLSKYRVTLSTSGVVPAMYELQKNSECSLAVSLHAPNDTLRSSIMPVNKKFPLKELMRCCEQYFKDSPKRKITMEYIMIAGINDQIEHARQLVKCLAKCPSKINLIPFNPIPGNSYQSSSRDTILSFQKVLMDAGFQTTIRKTRGQDIEAACGQLAGDVLDITQHTPGGRERRKLRRANNTLSVNQQ